MSRVKSPRKSPPKSKIYSIVNITKGKHAGDKAIIWDETSKQYKVRSLTATPIINRFRYCKGDKVCGTSGKFETYNISKNAVVFTGKKRKINVNDYMDDTMALLTKNSGLSRQQIQQKYK